MYIYIYVYEKYKYIQMNLHIYLYINTYIDIYTNIHISSPLHRDPVANSLLLCSTCVFFKNYWDAEPDCVLFVSSSYGLGTYPIV